MATISVYLNSRASQSAGQFSQEDFLRFFFRHKINIYSPDTAESLKDLIEQDILNKTDYVFSVGGDGTANMISQYLVGSHVKLMVVPTGTANDLANEIGVSSNLQKISNILNTQTTKKIDAINVNGKLMMTNGGIGIACAVAASINDFRKKNLHFKKVMKLLGKQTYPIMFAQKILSEKFQLRNVLLESPDLPLLDPRVRTALILINNQAYIGGKFNVAPHTKNNDGKFNVTIFTHQNKLDLIKCAVQILMGMYPDDKNIISFETDRLTLNSTDGKPLDFFGDGEKFPKEEIINISVMPQALEVCTYKGESLLCSSLSLDAIEMIQ